MRNFFHESQVVRIYKLYEVDPIFTISERILYVFNFSKSRIVKIRRNNFHNFRLSYFSGLYEI